MVWQKKTSNGEIGLDKLEQRLTRDVISDQLRLINRWLFWLRGGIDKLTIQDGAIEQIHHIKGTFLSINYHQNESYTIHSYIRIYVESKFWYSTESSTLNTSNENELDAIIRKLSALEPLAISNTKNAINVLSKMNHSQLNQIQFQDMYWSESFIPIWLISIWWRNNPRLIQDQIQLTC